MNGTLGVGTEDRIDLPCVEAKRVESTLELGDVLTAKHGATEEEEPVTEAVARLVQCPPRLRTDDAIGVEPAGRLEGPDGHGGGVSELAPAVVSRFETESRQAVLDVAYCFARRARSIQAHPHDGTSLGACTEHGQVRTPTRGPAP